MTGVTAKKTWARKRKKKEKKKLEMLRASSDAFRTATVPERRALSRVHRPVHRLLLACSLWRHLLLLSLNNSNMDARRLRCRWLGESSARWWRGHLLLLVLLDGRCGGLRTISLHRGRGGTRCRFVLIDSSVEMGLCCSVDVEGLGRHGMCLK